MCALDESMVRHPKTQKNCRFFCNVLPVQTKMVMLQELLPIGRHRVQKSKNFPPASPSHVRGKQAGFAVNTSEMSLPNSFKRF